MPKSLSEIFGLEPPRKKRRRKKKRKQKPDYTELLQQPVVTSSPCPHTKKVQDSSRCSQCMGVEPSIVKRPKTADWWASEDDGLEVSLDILDVDTTIILDDE